MTEPTIKHPHNLNIIEKKESEDDTFDSELFESLGEEMDLNLDDE